MNAPTILSPGTQLATGTTPARAKGHTSHKRPSPRKKKGGAAAKEAGPQLSREAAEKLDALRMNTVGLLTRHLEAPLLTQQRLSSRSAAGRALAGERDAGGMSEAEAAATAGFLQSLTPEALALYGDPAAAEMARRVEQAELRAHYTYQQPYPPPLPQPQPQQRSAAGARADAAPRPVDDRITSQTLHLLLGKNRAAAERMLPRAMTSRPTPLGAPTGSAAPAAQRQQARAELAHREPPALVACAGTSRYYYPGPTPPPPSSPLTEVQGPATAAAAAASAANYHVSPPTGAAESLLRYPPLAPSAEKPTAMGTTAPLRRATESRETPPREWAAADDAGGVDFHTVDLPPSRRAQDSSLQFALTAAATRGDDGSIVQQLVKLYDASGTVGRTACTAAALTSHALRLREAPSQDPPTSPRATALDGSPPPPQHQHEHEHEPHTAPPMLEAVLAVSREFEMLRATCDAASFASNRHPSPAPRLLPSGAAARARARVMTRLTALESTQVPEQYWVSVKERVAPSSRTHARRTLRGGADGAGTHPPLDPRRTSGVESVRRRPNSSSSSDEALSESTVTPSLQERQRRQERQVADNAESVRAASHVPCAELDASRVVGTDPAAAGPGAGGGHGGGNGGLILFPAPRPVGRAQVYLLAETLDHMLVADPTWLPTLADREVAYTILPPSPEPTVDQDPEHANALVDPEVQWRSGQAFEAYTRAAAQVLRVADVGLVELVRQVACQCVERGALMDALRQMVLDVATSQLRVLAHAKERAFEEATARMAIREELTHTVSELRAAQATIRDMEARQEAAQKEEVVLREKAARLDELVNRVYAKRNRYEVHSEDEHMLVLTELERQMRQGASEALASIYEEKLRLAGLHNMDDDDDDDHRGLVVVGGRDGDGVGGGEGGARSDSPPPTSPPSDALAATATPTRAGLPDGTLHPPHGSRGMNMWLNASPAAAAAAGITEAPSAEEARKRASEQRRAASILYEQSHQLLHTLHEATLAMNAASAPLYDTVVLAKVSPAAGVASSRWAAVARAVGAFEKERTHRQRVFAVFCDWCERYQRQSRREKREALRLAQGASPTAAGVGGVASPASADGHETDEMVSSPQHAASPASPASPRSPASPLTGGGGGFLVPSDSDSEVFGRAPGSGGRQRSAGASLCSDSAASFMNAPEPGASHRHGATLAARGARAAVREVTRGATTGGRTLSEIKYITSTDLHDMGVHDCTSEEVNALFAAGFDFKKYLHPTWRPEGSGTGGAEAGEEGGAAGRQGSPRRGAGAASESIAGEWSLTLSDVAAMVQDVQATLREMTARMRAIASSAILRKGAEPPMEAPARPEDPCPLCDRRDTQTEERTRRQQALRQVAREVQVRLDDLTERRQRAEAEREDARSEARRLRNELDTLKQQMRQVQEVRERDLSSTITGDPHSPRGRRTSGPNVPHRGIIKRRGSAGMNSSTSSVPPLGGSTTGGRGKARKVGIAMPAQGSKNAEVGAGTRRRRSSDNSSTARSLTRSSSGSRTSREERELGSSVESSAGAGSGTGSGTIGGDREVPQLVEAEETSAQRRGTLPPSAAVREYEGGPR